MKQDFPTTNCVQELLQPPGTDLWFFTLSGGPYDGQDYGFPVIPEATGNEMLFAEVLDRVVYLPIGNNYAKYQFELGLHGGRFVHQGTFSWLDQILDETETSLKPQSCFAFRKESK